MNIQRKCAWAASIALAACLALSEPATAACYSFVKIAKDNDNSPEGTIGVSSAFTPGINKDGLVAFIAHLEGGVDAVLVGEGTGLTTVAKSGSVIHQFTGAPSINARRMVAFAADTGVSAPSIVVADSGVLTVVAPGQGGASPYVAFNDDGAVLYREILGPGDERLVVALSGSSTVLYDTNSGQFGSPPGARGTVFDGAPALNNRGVAAFYASLKSGGSGLFTGSGGRTVTIASTPPLQTGSLLLAVRDRTSAIEAT